VVESDRLLGARHLDAAEPGHVPIRCRAFDQPLVLDVAAFASCTAHHRDLDPDAAV